VEHRRGGGGGAESPGNKLEKGYGRKKVSERRGGFFHIPRSKPSVKKKGAKECLFQGYAQGRRKRGGGLKKARNVAKLSREGGGCRVFTNRNSKGDVKWEKGKGWLGKLDQEGGVGVLSLPVLTKGNMNEGAVPEDWGFVHKNQPPRKADPAKWKKVRREEERRSGEDQKGGSMLAGVWYKGAGKGGVTPGGNFFRKTQKEKYLGKKERAAGTRGGGGTARLDGGPREGIGLSVVAN